MKTTPLLDGGLATAPLQQRFQALFANAMVGIAYVDRDMRWRETNPTLCRMLGYSAGELAERRVLDVLHPDERSSWQARFDEALLSPVTAHHANRRFVHRDGSVIEVSISAQVIRDASGHGEGFAVVIADLTETRNTERQLAQQVARAGLLLELPQRAATLDECDFLRYTLDHALALTGSPWGALLLTDSGGADQRETLSGSPPEPKLATAWLEIKQRHALPDPPASVPVDRDSVAESPLMVAGLESTLIAGDDLRLLLALAVPPGSPEEFTGETLQLVANAGWRLVHHRRSEQALQLAMRVLNASQVVCFRWAAGKGWPVVFVSENVAQWGYAAARLIAGDPPFAELVHPDDLARIAEEVARLTAAGAQQYDQEYRLLTADQQVIWVHDRTIVHRQADGSADYYDGVLTDISERKAQQLQLAERLHHEQQLNKRLEEANNQLLQSEKMASIGQLAAGVAHELNNPIGFVHSNLGTLEGYLHDLMAVIDTLEQAALTVDPAKQAEIDRVKRVHDYDYLKDDIFTLIGESRDGLSRLRKIVLDLKNFAHTGEQEWQPADLRQGLESTLNIVWNELKYKCDIVRDYEEIPPVECLISQINQVFMNLLVNAGHAVETRGTITLRTRRLADDKVCVEIADSGKGITHEHLHRIFEPFFTTKPVGTGTGLGLSVSYGIVQRHHGRIEVSSQPGQGSSFCVILPVRQPR